MESKKALITGGSGYFGECLTEELLKRGFKCSILDLNKPEKSLEKRVRFFQGDIRDKILVDSACAGIDYVFHNVAQVPLSKDEKLFKSVNDLGTRNIIESSKKNNCSHLVYTSSSAIFGVPKENPLNENSTTEPFEAYGESKLIGEKHCLDNINEETKISIIRPRTILGKGRLGIFQILFEWIFMGKNIPVFNKGDNIFQFIHAKDLAIACILAAESNKDNIFNVGANDLSTIRELLEELIFFAKKNSKIISFPSNFIVPVINLLNLIGLSPLSSYHSNMYGKEIYFNCSKIKTELNWSPKYSNKEMIKESYKWYVVNRANILSASEIKSFHKSSVKKGVITIFEKFL
tara:strand:+ start:2819 stop:3862 length:1044 start_codon:yes stop_codon:yes gene_type:complete